MGTHLPSDFLILLEFGCLNVILLVMSLNNLTRLSFYCSRKRGRSTFWQSLAQPFLSTHPSEPGQFLPRGFERNQRCTDFFSDRWAIDLLFTAAEESNYIYIYIIN